MGGSDKAARRLLVPAGVHLMEKRVELAELSGRTADAVADVLAGVTLADLDLQQRRWLLVQIDCTMTLACEDWRAKLSWAVRSPAIMHQARTLW
jgi:hypothetical protein